MTLTPHSKELQQLLSRYLSGKATKEEIAFVEASYTYFDKDQYDPELCSTLETSALRDKIYATLHDRINHPAEKTIHFKTIRFKRIYRYAAAALLILAIGSGVYYLNNQSHQSNKSSQITVQTKEPQAISPGTSKAILILENGTKKELGMADNGLQLQSNALLLTTPRGGQYQAVLPDGSKVWLNAASSIKFPSTFTDKERRVTITGEVYFEIAKDASKPFKVSGGGQEIEVLGTSFNAKFYDDEASKTSLIEGLVKVNNTILQPGKAYTNGRTVSTNMAQDLAWKSGLFSFDGKSLKEMMLQISRWYDIDVKYEGKIPEPELSGKMDRNLALPDILIFLKDLNINYRMEGRTLILTQ